MPKKRNKGRTTKSSSAVAGHPIRKSALPTASKSDIHEHELFDWILAQWLLADSGLLPKYKVESLNKLSPDWFRNYTANDAAHAIVCEDTELQDALEAWWNARKLSDEPMTYTEIREKALSEI